MGTEVGVIKTLDSEEDQTNQGYVPLFLSLRDNLHPETEQCQTVWEAGLLTRARTLSYFLGDEC